MRYSLLTSEEARQFCQNEEWGNVNHLAGAIVGNAVGVSLGRVILKPGGADPCHTHDNCEEVIYVLSGVLGYSVGDENVIMRSGDTLVIPAGMFHNGVNLGLEPVEVLCVHSVGMSEIRPALAAFGRR